MTAAQLYVAACQANPEIPPAIARGDFRPLMAWLRPNVHERGSSMTTAEIVTAATGRPLDVGVFKAHLKRRYLPD
jgi:carboxypeptidase Taq